MEQIFRIPNKYWELINTMSDEDCWKLMKALFEWKNDKLEWLILTYYNIIIVDINNIQNQVNKWRQGWILWWRPKKKGGVIEKEKGGLWNKKPNIKESNINKDNIYKKQYEEFIKDNINKRNLSAYLLKYFLLLWYKPKEDIDKFRDWTKSRIIDVYKLTYWDFTDAVNKFYDYWIEQSPQKRTKKNWKSTFTSSFNLTSLPKNNV